MTPLFHSQLVNEPFGDPGLYVEFKLEKRALVFDLGDLGALSTRKILRISHAFVSHTHMDHFAGFDRLLRILLGRNKTLHLFGPPGFIDRVRHKLAAYSWNLVHRFETNLVLRVVEVHPADLGSVAEFHLKEAFARRELEDVELKKGLLIDEEGFRVRSAFVDHGIPCLAFALEEKRHVNVWRNAVEQWGYRVGPWLRELRQAVLSDDPDERLFRVWWRDGEDEKEDFVALGELKQRLLRIVPGQKIAYVVDAAYHEANARKIIRLVDGADILFIEAAFLSQDAAVAADKRHLTAAQAGLLARQARAVRLVPFHFSTRYSGDADSLVREAYRAWAR